MCLTSYESYTPLKYKFRISQRAISYNFAEVAQAMIEIPGTRFLKSPSITKECEAISLKFMQTWNFPN